MNGLLQSSLISSGLQEPTLEFPATSPEALEMTWGIPHTPLDHAKPPKHAPGTSLELPKTPVALPYTSFQPPGATLRLPNPSLALPPATP